MLKAELIEALAPKIPNIIDEPIPEINIPIMKPNKPIRNSRITSLKDLARQPLLLLRRLTIFQIGFYLM